MEVEAGSGAAEGAGNVRQAPVIPEGWIVVPAGPELGGFYYRPDVKHPQHPYNDPRWQGSKTSVWLESDPELQRYIAENRERFSSAFQEFIRQRDLVAPGGEVDSITLEALRAGSSSFMAKVFGAIKKASRDY